MQGRRQPEQYARDNRQREREAQHRSVDADLLRARKPRRRENDKDPHPNQCQGDTQNATDQRQKNALGQ